MFVPPLPAQIRPNKGGGQTGLAEFGQIWTPKLIVSPLQIAIWGPRNLKIFAPAARFPPENKLFGPKCTPIQIRARQGGQTLMISPDIHLRSCEACGRTP